MQAIRTTWDGAPRPARFFGPGREFTDVLEAVLDLCHELRRRGGTHARAYRDFLRAICLSDRQRWLPSSPEVDRLGPSRMVGLLTDILGAYFREDLLALPS